MAQTPLTPENEVYWYLNCTYLPPLRYSLKTDVVIVGGGMAGITAAQAFHEKGMRVVLLEKSYCGGGASGKSSGFITPDSEFSLSSMTEKYGLKIAADLWQFVTDGVKRINKNISDYSLECDYIIQDNLVVASSPKAFTTIIEKEHTARQQLQYPSTLIEKDQVENFLGSNGYYGAITYPGSFGICAYLYCQEMKHVLAEKGVKIFEESPVISVQAHSVSTPHATVEADYVILCTDRYTPELGKLTHEIYHAQNFLLMSAPLSDKTLHQIFPERNFMVWDTDMIYQYFRIVKENRLMVGGGSLLSTYAKKMQYGNSRARNKLLRYFKHKFPAVDVTFEYMWPGFIGITKDIMPIAGRDKDYPSMYYIAGAAGLPWAAALAAYSADSIINNRHDLDEYFSPYRKFPIGPGLQTLLGTRLSFALSNFTVVGTL